MSINTIEPH